MAALGSSHRCCSGVLLCPCCASPTTPTEFWCSLFPRWNTKGKYRKSRETLEGQLHWERSRGAVWTVPKEAGFPPHTAAEKGQRVLFSYLCEAQCSWYERDSFLCPQTGRRGYVLFSTSAGTVCGKHCWHWDFVLSGFCSVLQIRLLFPWSLCRNGKHAWAFKHTLKSIKTVLKYISLL